jgi:hypothetical protein
MFDTIFKFFFNILVFEFGMHGGRLNLARIFKYGFYMEKVDVEAQN